MPLSQPIENYRNPWESDENWELREEFLLQYADTFEENRLLCLAQAYVNVLLLDCQYPEAVMQQVNTLSKDLGKGAAVRDVQNERAKETAAKKQKTANKREAEQLGTTIRRGWNQSDRGAQRYF